MTLWACFSVRMSQCPRFRRSDKWGVSPLRAGEKTPLVGRGFCRATTPRHLFVGSSRCDDRTARASLRCLRSFSLKLLTSFFEFFAFFVVKFSVCPKLGDRL